MEQYIPPLGTFIKTHRGVMAVNLDAEFFYSRVRTQGYEEVLDIGTGNGILAILAAHRGAKRVVATDINPRAVRNAKENIARLGLENIIEVREVPESDPHAFSTVCSDERFDLIISNPPFDSSTGFSGTREKEYAEVDPEGVLIKSIFEDARRHLNEGGKLLILYGWGVSAKRQVERLTVEAGFKSKFITNRKRRIFVCECV